jgi:hypothetical protein
LGRFEEVSSQTVHMKVRDASVQDSRVGLVRSAVPRTAPLRRTLPQLYRLENIRIRGGDASSTFRQIMMGERHCHGTLTYCGSATFHGTVANVAGGKESGNVGFEIIRIAIQRPSLRHLAMAE